MSNINTNLNKMEKIKSRWRRNYLEGDIKSNHEPPTYEHLEENLYLDERNEEEQRRTRKEGRSMVCDCRQTKDERARGVKGCLEGCLNRMLMIECSSRCTLGENCSNKRFQKSQSVQLELYKTRKKGWGLRTIDDLPPNTFVMEYVGEVIRAKEFRTRVKKYTKQKIKHHYFMALRNEEIIDATTKGNLTRFINHSCEPNCETQKWTVNGELRIGFFTIKNIRAGEEITFDYQFQRYGKKAQRCYCEAPSCRGYIGGNEQTYSLNNGGDSPLGGDENKSSDNQETNQETGFRIPRLNRLQRLEIEMKLEEEMKAAAEASGVNNGATSSDHNIHSNGIERRTPFATTNFFKPTPIPVIKPKFQPITVLANNNSIKPNLEIGGEEQQAFSISSNHHDEYYSNSTNTAPGIRITGTIVSAPTTITNPASTTIVETNNIISGIPTYQDVTHDLYPYPGSYYTTPDGDTWFATVILDKRTQQPRTVIMNLQINNKNINK